MMVVLDIKFRVYLLFNNAVLRVAKQTVVLGIQCGISINFIVVVTHWKEKWKRKYVYLYIYILSNVHVFCCILFISEQTMVVFCFIGTSEIQGATVAFGVPLLQDFRKYR